MKHILAAAFVLTLAGQAQAGDAAARNVLGFSADGKVFAFEQYTMVYEAEVSLSEYYFVDTAADRFMPGTPVSVRISGDDGLDEKKARADAAAKAAPLVQKYGISDRGKHFPGAPSMALDDIGIYHMEPKPLARRQEIELPDGRKAVLTLARKPMGSAMCDGAGGRGTKGKVAVSGLSLTLEIGGKKLPLQDDKKLPANRRCVSDYGIAEAWLHTAADKTLSLAVLVETVDNHDYHAGPSRRFMAVTKRLPSK